MSRDNHSLSINLFHCRMSSLMYQVLTELFHFQPSGLDLFLTERRLVLQARPVWELEINDFSILPNSSGSTTVLVGKSGDHVPTSRQLAEEQHVLVACACEPVGVYNQWEAAKSVALLVAFTIQRGNRSIFV
eukprot:CAMPEP_0114511924 /NCGR_PEP_ID=MMETSP0109-20121206/14678_1 /TAXON_ID=29199 /ORGANISM="Chlorarachnion reptans, Strain CCCM449" /LENGTH=131 /DNA_ID=CAMNT_0001691527 /DNA_START=524 /DNA_END=919 /DNA_ORIENTATION=+